MNTTIAVDLDYGNYPLQVMKLDVVYLYFLPGISYLVGAAQSGQGCVPTFAKPHMQRFVLGEKTHGAAEEGLVLLGGG